MPYSEGCGGIMWDAWGGTSGVEWATNKLKQIEKNQIMADLVTTIKTVYFKQV